MGKLDGRVALVTGGASGIGGACSETLAREGAAVVITDVQDEMGQALAQAIVKAGGKARYLRHDVTSEDAWVGGVADIEKTEGRLDVLVNNAGIAVPAMSITQVTLEDWRKQQSVNVEGVFLGLKHSLPLMRKERGTADRSSTCRPAGRPEGLAGPGVLQRQQGRGAAAHQVDRPGMRQLQGRRPGQFHAPGANRDPDLAADRAAAAGVNTPPDLDAMSTAVVPLGVKGVPQDIANGVLWLASDDSSYVTGMEMVIDGGMTLR